MLLESQMLSYLLLLLNFRLQKGIHETVFRVAMNRLDDFYSMNKNLAVASKSRFPFFPGGRNGANLVAIVVLE